MFLKHAYFFQTGYIFKFLFFSHTNQPKECTSVTSCLVISTFRVAIRRYCRSIRHYFTVSPLNPVCKIMFFRYPQPQHVLRMFLSFGVGFYQPKRSHKEDSYEKECNLANTSFVCEVDIANPADYVVLLLVACCSQALNLNRRPVVSSRNDETPPRTQDEPSYATSHAGEENTSEDDYDYEEEDLSKPKPKIEVKIIQHKTARKHKDVPARKYKDGSICIPKCQNLCVPACKFDCCLPTHKFYDAKPAPKPKPQPKVRKAPSSLL